MAKGREMTALHVCSFFTVKISKYYFYKLNKSKLKTNKQKVTSVC